MSAVILPGSYDPITLGHLEIVKYAAERYDEVYLVSFVNPEKNYSFTLDERVKMMMLSTEEYDNVLVSYSTGYVIDYMREHGIEKIIKGYRNDADLEYEKKQAEWNLAHGGYETELVKCEAEFSGISSTLAREKIRLGEDLSDVLHPAVISYLKSRE